MIENKRYVYWEESDTAYDTKIKYGQYFRIIDKKDMVYLLNEQEEIIIEQCIQLDFLKNENQHMKDVLDENKQLKKHLKEVLKELYCKDRKLEELGISIECCDDGDVE
jgi:hypothetical protein